MKVLLRRNIPKLGKIGDMVEVKAGYARNYLLPERLAVAPTAANLKAIEAEKAAYLAELARVKAEMETKAAALAEKEVTVAARANVEGHLYGSIGPAQVCEALAKDGIFVEPENIVLDAPIRQLDKYDVTVRFAEDVQATIHVWVVPIREGEPTTSEDAEEAGEAEEALDDADR